MRDAIVFRRFSVFVWTGENDSNTLRVDAYFFENGGKKTLRFQKYPDTCGQGLRVKFTIFFRHLILCFIIFFRTLLILCCLLIAQKARPK